MIDEQDTKGPLDISLDSSAQRVVDRLTVIVRPPANMRIVRQGSDLLIWLTDRGKFLSKNGISGADHYDILWAEDVDGSSKAGIDAGAARATKVGEVSRVFIDGKELLVEITNGKFQNGFFYAFGANAIGDRSTDYLFSGKQTNEIVDDTLPPDVTNFTASESGEQQNGTMVSAVAFKYFAPNSAPAFAGVQFVAENYPNPGEVTFLSPDWYRGAPGGESTGKLFLVPARRVGLGLITITNGLTTVTIAGGKPIAQFAVGDLVEILGVSGTVQAVSNTPPHLTLTAPWVGKSQVGFAEYWAIGQARIYAVALSKARTHRDYPTAPFADVVLDADFSAPLAPTLVGLALGNTNRIIVTPAAGTSIDFVTLYRGLGAGLASTDPLVKAIHTWRKETNNLDAVLQFDDVDFTTYQRENGQTFSYFAAATNVRGNEGAFSSRLELACRLDSPSDGGGTVPARFVAASLTWNNMFAGTAGDVNLAGATQDAGMGYALPAGFHRWVGAVTGAGSGPGFQNTTEVILGIVGIGAAGSSILTQDIGAWDGANGRVPKGKMVTFQFKAYHTPGTVNGVLSLQIAHFFGGGLTGLAHIKTRDATTDAELFTTTTLTINGTDLPALPTLYRAAFLLRSDVPTDTIQVGLAYQTTNYSGVNIVITEPMLSLGDGLPYWSPWVDPNTLYSPPSGGATVPPGRFIDRDGSSRDIVGLP